MHLAHIADGKIAVQRLADADGFSAPVMAGQVDVQLLVEANAQRQVHLVRPARKAAVGVGQEEFDFQAFAFGFDAAQLPIHRSHEAVSRRRFIADAHRLHALRVTVEDAEPRPAHRHAGTDALAGLEHSLVVEPDQRRLAGQLIAEDVRALLGHQ
ncbi:hypothetical protein D3C71_1350160 [compost metagenome]